MPNDLIALKAPGLEGALDQLPLIEAIGHDGKMTDAAGEFAGLNMQDARQAIINKIWQLLIFL